jgi:hypothetical protein
MSDWSEQVVCRTAAIAYGLCIAEIDMLITKPLYLQFALTKHFLVFVVVFLR